MTVRVHYILITFGGNQLTTKYNVDDELWNIASSEDDYLGFDHPDRTRALRNGVGDLFLR